MRSREENLWVNRGHQFSFMQVFTFFPVLVTVLMCKMLQIITGFGLGKKAASMKLWD